MHGGDFELAWDSRKSGFYKFYHIVHGGVINADSTFGNNEKRFHPTQKPISLMGFCINDTSAQTILDPFMGSGTTLRAAKDLGRKAIGIEIEEKYCEIAAKRMSQEVLNLTARS
jgi:site-specific DNA-methyltransferase (adenine-specific)